eukprot:COSAG02_NODE_17267_length_1017_cov_1.130719_2_plen_113_part_00
MTERYQHAQEHIESLEQELALKAVEITSQQKQAVATLAELEQKHQAAAHEALLSRQRAMAEAREQATIQQQSEFEAALAECAQHRADNKESVLRLSVVSYISAISPHPSTSV